MPVRKSQEYVVDECISTHFTSNDIQGIAFCEYLEPAATDIAVEGLNDMELGDKHLKVQRASIGVTQASGLEMGVNAMSMLAGTTSTDLEEGRVLQLLNMVTPEELIDNQEYEGTLVHLNPLYHLIHLIASKQQLILLAYLRNL